MTTTSGVVSSTMFGNNAGAAEAFDTYGGSFAAGPELSAPLLWVGARVYAGL